MAAARKKKQVEVEEMQVLDTADEVQEEKSGLVINWREIANEHDVMLDEVSEILDDVGVPSGANGTKLSQADRVMALAVQAQVGRSALDQVRVQLLQLKRGMKRQGNEEAVSFVSSIMDEVRAQVIVVD